MTQEEIQKISERIIEEFGTKLFESHSALAKTYSNQQGEILTKLGGISEEIKGIHRRQDITNGRIAKNEQETISLREADIRILDTLKNHMSSEEKWVKGIDAAMNDEKNGRTWWLRQVGWWAFLSVSGLIAWILLKVKNL